MREAAISTAPSTRAPRWWWPSVAVLLLCVAGLYAPMLRIDYAADDFWQIAALEGLFGDGVSPFDLYAFSTGNATEIAAHIARGSLPWWTTSDWTFAMVRPLSSLTIVVDHRFAPRAVGWHHLHSLLWMWLSIVMVARWFRVVLSPGLAMLALVCFVIDESLGVSVSWIANRCSFISMCFAMGAWTLHCRRTGLVVHDGWRLVDDRATRAREFGWWVLAFLGGEYAACGVAFVIAMQLCAPRRSWHVRFVACAPALIAFALFLGMFWSFGGSARGLIEYADPVHAPADFLTQIGHKIPRLLGELWFSIYGDSKWILRQMSEMPRLLDWLGEWGLMLPFHPWRHALLSGAMLPLVGWLLWFSARSLDSWHRFLLIALVVGGVFALIPLCSTAPQTRLLVFPSLAPSVLVVLMGAALWRPVRRTPAPTARPNAGAGSVWRWPAVALLCCLVFLDVVVEARGSRAMTPKIVRGQRSLRASLTTPQMRDKSLDGAHVVVMSAPGFILGVHGITMHGVFSSVRPATFHTLTFGPRAYLLTRVSDTAFEMTGVGRSVLTDPDERSFRRAERSLRPGEVVDTGVFRASVVRESRPGHAQTLRFEFRESLESSRLHFFVSTIEGYVPFEFPAVGETAVVPLPKLPLPARDPGVNP